MENHITPGAHASFAAHSNRGAPVGVGFVDLRGATTREHAEVGVTADDENAFRGVGQRQDVVGVAEEHDALCRDLANGLRVGRVIDLPVALGRMLEQAVIDRVLERAEAAGIAQRVADRILEDGIAEQIAERVLSGPELERMLTAAFQSSLPEEVISQLLASEAVWILVDEIARSPSVTEAIAHQSTGFLDQVAGKARDRSRQADARLQRIARRIGRDRGHPGREAGELLPSPPNPRQGSP